MYFMLCHIAKRYFVFYCTSIYSLYEVSKIKINEMKYILKNT